MKNVQQFEPGLLPTYAVILFISSIVVFQGRSTGYGTTHWGMGIAPSPTALGPTMDSFFVAVFRFANAICCCCCCCSYCWCCCRRRRRYKWHCNIISVENTSKCNPALHVFVRQPGTRWVGTHTHTQKLPHTHAQLLWLVSICVYICACICWHPLTNTRTLAGIKCVHTHTDTHLHPSLRHVFASATTDSSGLSLSLCVYVFVCGVCALALFFFYGRRFGPSHLCLFSYFCGLPLFAYISTTFVVSPVSVRALDTCQNMTSLPTTTSPPHPPACSMATTY